MRNKGLVRRTKIVLSPDSSRVVLRQFKPSSGRRIASIIERINTLSEKEVARNLKVIVAHFFKRHLQTEETLLAHYESVKSLCDTSQSISDSRKLLIGAYFTNEYAFESTALFNPAIVAHPDQSGLPCGSVRFIMSLRATGEGHISSLTFRTGIIDAFCNVSIDPISRYAAVAGPVPNTSYDKNCFRNKLSELGFENDFSGSVLAVLPDSFTITQLRETLSEIIGKKNCYAESDKRVHDKILWLALSNYSVFISDQHPISHWVIFPASPTEKNGIEDARFVRFTDDDGSFRYYATYTAYDGKVIQPQLIETDFKNFKMITLNGRAVQNKGMALFPRKVNGRFAMLSRQDNESIHIMYSDNSHFWHESKRIVSPKYNWEFVQIGNCGSPIETEFGWLVLTHGVGPFRQYAIGALLLDRNDPSQVIGRLSEPLLMSTAGTRDGYVPNVVYSCGSMIHKEKLIVPYALSDSKSTVAVIELRGLFEAFGAVT